MTDGDEEGTVPWVEKLGVRYPYAYERAHFAFRSNIWAYPYAILIDPGGVVVWVGHPTQLEEATIKRHLPGALTRPLWTWSGDAAPIKAAVLAGEWARAHELAAELDLAAKPQSGPSWTEAVATLTASRKRGVLALRESGDAYSAWQGANALLAQIGELPLREEVQALTDDMGEDPDFVEAYALQEKVWQIAAKPATTKAEAQAVIAELEEAVKGKVGTMAARDAQLVVGFLARMIDLGSLE